MPFTVTYERGGRGVHVLMTGRVTYEEMRETFDSIWTRPEAEALRYHILEGHPDLNMDIPVERYRDVGLMAPEIEKINPKVVSAFVTGRRIIRGIVDLVLIYSRVWGNSPNFEVFSEIGEARAWIARQCPDLENERPDAGETNSVQ